MTNFLTNFVATALCTYTTFQLLPGNVKDQRSTNATFLYQPMTNLALRVEIHHVRVTEWTDTNWVELTARQTSGPPVWRAPEGPPPLPTYPGFYPSKQ